MSEQVQTSIIAIGALFILYGVFRLIYINHQSPNNVSLTRWMLTGGLFEFVIGLFKGTVNIFRLYLDENAFGAIFVYFGVLLIALAL